MRGLQKNGSDFQNGFGRMKALFQIRLLFISLSGRNTARAWLGRWLPMYPPFPASWQMAIRPYITFPQAPLRSRTVGSPESGSDLGFSSYGLPDMAEA
jgi:hypothetical protein